ncbi:Solute carrier family 2, facilitated glucose transporter member 14 [Trichinella papuae]|uniref:Solute carrier family 2, facilitated glucose transporter member 14 n=1 Tax=Trichinella papuae TaxID=268474 RepID=A0A0V1N3D2_9BILA|nr:Solute carrier family 2, facilitated glucose transporter member 14 [Trichinella papuae]
MCSFKWSFLNKFTLPTWKWTNLMLTVLMVSAGGSFQLYNFGVVNLPHATIQRWINETFASRTGSLIPAAQLDAFWSALVSSVSLGAFIGSLCVCPLAERFGRKSSLLFISWFNVFGCLLIAICKLIHAPESLFIGRLIIGFCMGVISGIAPLYLTEIAPSSLRGAVGSCHQTFILLGDCLSLLIPLPSVLGSEQNWPLAFSITAILGLALALYLPLTHESSTWLFIKRGNKEAAFRSIDFFIKDSKIANEKREQLEREHKMIRHFQRKKKEQSTSKLYNLFHRSELLTPLKVVVVVIFSQQFTAGPAIFSYSTDLFVTAKLSLTVAQYSTLALGIMCFFSALPASYLIEKIGRRKLYLVQLIGCFISMLLISIFMMLQTHGHSEWTSYGIIGAGLLYMAVYGVGSSIPWIISAELFTEDYRSIAVSISTALTWLLSFVSTLLFLPLKDAIGGHLCLLPFLLGLGIFTALISVLLPETKNKTIEEVLRDFRRRRQSLSSFGSIVSLGMIGQEPQLSTTLEPKSSSISIIAQQAKS